MQANKILELYKNKAYLDSALALKIFLAAVHFCHKREQFLVSNLESFLVVTLHFWQQEQWNYVEI